MDIKKDFAERQSQAFIRLRVFVTSGVPDDDAMEAVGKAADILVKSLRAAGLEANIYLEPRLKPIPYSRLKYEAEVQVEGTEGREKVYEIVRADKGIIKVE